MEQSKLYCTLTDAELSAKAQYWIDKLIKSGGKDFIRQVPARPNEDTDLILAELEQRFLKYCNENAALQAKSNKLALALRRLALSVYVHPDYGKGQPNEFFDRVEGAHLALAEWKGEKEPANRLVTENEYGYVTMNLEDNEEVVKAQENGCMLEMALFQAGYKKGKKATVSHQCEVWVKASERLPKLGGWYFVRAGKLKDKYLWPRMALLERHKEGVIFEWLDESAGEKEVDLLGFAEWAAITAWFDDGTGLWELMAEGEAINGQFRFTTKEFFEIYKKGESGGR